MNRPLPRLFLNHIAEFDWLIALEFGRVDDGQPREDWRGVCDEVGFLEPGGVCVGFKAVEFSTLDPESDELAELWSAPHFDVPALGLSGICAGEILVAARTFFAGESSINRHFFNAAMDAEGKQALLYWRACLESGDAMAHYGLGYTLYDLGIYPAAYRHLRHYTEISPCGPWNWCWYGRAAQAMGLIGEARAAYRRAIELEDLRGEETDAQEFLEELDA